MMAVALACWRSPRASPAADEAPRPGDPAFAVFNIFMNVGPNATTYALPAEVFPSEVRAAGHGFAAGCAKLGAAVGVFLFPILMDDIGTSALLLIVAGGCLLAFVVTAVFAIEPRGRSLDEVSGAEAAEVAPHPVPP